MGKGSRNRDSRTPNAATQGTAKPNLSKRLTSIGICVLVVLFCAVFIWGLVDQSGILQRSVTALTIGHYQITGAEYRVNYVNAKAQFISDYGMYFSTLGIDSTQPLEGQLRSDGSTWGQYFVDSALVQLKEVYVLCGEAEKAGYTPSDEVEANLEAYMASLEEAAAGEGMSLEKYIKTYFGSAIRPIDIEKTMRNRFIATEYYQVLYDSYEFTDEQLEAYYQENKAEFDRVSYRYFTFPYEKVTYSEPPEGSEPAEGAPKSLEEADEMNAENKAAAKALAEAMLAEITNEASFITAAQQYASDEDKEKYEDASATLQTNARVSEEASSGELAAWYRLEERKPGEKTVVDNGTGYTVLYFIERYREEYLTVSVRHILLQTQSAAYEATEEEIAEVDAANELIKAQVEELYAEWQNGEATEESFAALATEKTEDPGSQKTGGLYEEIMQGDMTTEFNNWLFEEGRQQGDHGIVQTSYGYHIMYLSCFNDPAWKVSARNDLKSEAYSTFFTEASEAVELVINEFGMARATT